MRGRAQKSSQVKCLATFTESCGQNMLRRRFSKIWHPTERAFEGQNPKLRSRDLWYLKEVWGGGGGCRCLHPKMHPKPSQHVKGMRIAIPPSCRKAARRIAEIAAEIDRFRW